MSDPEFLEIPTDSGTHFLNLKHATNVIFFDNHNGERCALVYVTGCEKDFEFRGEAAKILDAWFDQHRS